MRSTAKFVLGTLSLVATLACHQRAPESAALLPSGPLVALRGTVMEFLSSQRLQSAGVELTLPGDINHPIAASVTDEKGEFAFAPMPGGVYMVRVARPGYYEVRIRVDTARPDAPPLDVRLKSLGERCVPTRYHTEICP